MILGAGISGHTAATFAGKWPGRDDTVTVVSPSDSYYWIPSDIWVGAGLMGPDQVRFPLAPVYERHGIEFKQAWARERSTQRATQVTRTRMSSSSGCLAAPRKSGTTS